MNPTSGQIDTAATISIDRELKDKYTLVIKADDQGTPVLSSTCLVDVIVDDINDNAAVFSPVDFSVSLDENKVGLLLLYIVVTSAVTHALRLQFRAIISNKNTWSQCF